VQDDLPDDGPAVPFHHPSQGDHLTGPAARGEAGGMPLSPPMDRGGGGRPNDRVRLRNPMSVISALEWIESTDLSAAIREGALLYPILGGIHLLGIALFGGMLLATDLRLLGWAMQRRSVTDIVRQLRAWKWVGFVVV